MHRKGGGCCYLYCLGFLELPGLGSFLNIGNFTAIIASNISHAPFFLFYFHLCVCYSFLNSVLVLVCCLLVFHSNPESSC